MQRERHRFPRLRRASTSPGIAFQVGIGKGAATNINDLKARIAVDKCKKMRIVTTNTLCVETDLLHHLPSDWRGSFHPSSMLLSLINLTFWRALAFVGGNWSPRCTTAT